MRSYLEIKTDASKDVFSIYTLDKPVITSFRTNMADEDAPYRIENSFVPFKSLLRRDGLVWLTIDNEKVAVGHYLLAIRPYFLQARL